MLSRLAGSPSLYLPSLPRVNKFYSLRWKPIAAVGPVIRADKSVAGPFLFTFLRSSFRVFFKDLVCRKSLSSITLRCLPLIHLLPKSLKLDSCPDTLEGSVYKVIFASSRHTSVVLATLRTNPKVLRSFPFFGAAACRRSNAWHPWNMVHGLLYKSVLSY